ncbi:MAG: hypothetical protein ABI249_05470 [Ornithinibacter sp.]
MTSRTAFVLNILVAAVLTLVLRAMKAPAGEDERIRGDYVADEGGPRVQKLPNPIHQETPNP